MASGLSKLSRDRLQGVHPELIARQTSGSTKNVAANELTWFSVEVVE
jgi:hypothetical protein